MEMSTLVWIIIVGVFVFLQLVSSVLLRFGGSIHKKQGPPCTPGKFRASHRLIGHRGFKADKCPENTQLAFQEASKVPTDVIELDLWYTKDRRLVVFHDGTLDRICGVEGRHVRDFDYGDLPKIKLSDQEAAYLASLPAGAIEAATAAATTIPLFSDVLAQNTRVGMIVEFKENSDEMIAEVYELLSKWGRIESGSTCWFSLKKPINVKLQKYNVNGVHIPTITSVPEVLTTFVLYGLGLLPFVPLNFKIMGLVCFEINATVIRNLLGLPRCLCWFLNLFLGGNPSTVLIVPKMVKHLHDRGMGVCVLGMNDVACVDFVRKVGADCALTDHAGEISKSREWKELCDVWKDGERGVEESDVLVEGTGGLGAP
jgi:glycerophosphoryl diester phosphodiesterase